MTKHIIAIITLLGAISIGAYANGDPVIEHSAMTVSRTPVSRQIPEIQVTYERLDITPADLYTHITVLYRLHNTSRKKFRNIRYGFPIDWYGTGDSIRYANRDAWTESQREVGWRNDYVTDVSFALDGKRLAWKCSADSVLHEAQAWDDLKQLFDSTDNYSAYVDYVESGEVDHYDFENRLNRRWYYTTFTVPANSTVELTVSYTLANNYTSSLSEKCEALHDVIWTYNGKYLYPESHTSFRTNTFVYDFTPAAAWGNSKADSMEVNIHMQAVVHGPKEYDYHWNYLSGLSPDTLPGGNLQFKAVDFDYAGAELLELAFMTNYVVREDLDYIFAHRLSPEQYTFSLKDSSVDSPALAPLSDLDFTTAAQLPFRPGDTEILIHFHEPQYVTGFLLLNGWCKDSSAWAKSPKISSMMVWEKKCKKNPYGIDSYLIYGKSVRENNFSSHYDYYPASCRMTAPQQFTWDGVIAEAEKMNVHSIRDWILLNKDGTYSDFFERDYYDARVTDIRIVVTDVLDPDGNTSVDPDATQNAKAFMLSELMVLTAPITESAFGTYTITEWP